MSMYEWDGGQLLNLIPGDTATCHTLNQGQLYGLVFYNSALNATDASVAVVWSNSQPPVTLTVPGTTANQGGAAILFVSGDDTQVVSAAIPQNQSGAQVQALISSQKMPTNTTGIENLSLPADGQNHPFSKFTRYYQVPESHWYQVQVESSINQFISICYTSMKAATVSVVNKMRDPGETVIGVGKADKMFTIVQTTLQAASFPIQGNGGQVVWINADSTQNSQQAGISLQSLASVYALQGGRVAVGAGAR